MNTVPHPGAPRKKATTAALPSDELAARADSDLHELTIHLAVAVADLAERVRKLEDVTPTARLLPGERVVLRGRRKK